jgi:hypothetical protein
MKRLLTISILLVAVFLFLSPSTAQMKKSKNTTLVITEESVAGFIKPLMPFPIEFGKDFSGSFHIQSIEDIAIKNNGILFSSHIVGKDIRYSTKLGKAKAVIELGNVNLRNQWSTAFRYDGNKRRILIKPHIEGPGEDKNLSQGDLIVNALLVAFSDVEYPVEVDNIKPIAAEILNQQLIIKVDITDIYAADKKLFIELKPSAQKEKPKSQ